MFQPLIHLLERPTIYLAWQKPFVESKLAPLRRHNDLAEVRRVLDVGCGPGTNAALFAGTEYLGVDLNPAYIEFARKRHGREFQVADVRTDAFDGTRVYDFVLVNSLLHHLDDAEVDSLVASLPRRVSRDGHVHIIDLDRPEETGMPRLLAGLDRGIHARSQATWRELLTRHFDPIVFEVFPVPARGPVLWRMVYFKGALKA